MLVRISGYARLDGFTIAVRLPVSGDTWFIPFSVSPAPDESFDGPVAFMLAGGIAGAIWLHAFVIAAVLLWVATEILVFQRRRKSWHWCEHQVVKLIAEDFPMTEGLMRSQSATDPLCGSVYLLSRTMLYAAWIGATLHAAHGQWVAAVGCLIFAWSAATAHLVSKLDGQCGWWRVFGWPALRVAMILQRMFFLRKPDQRQAQQALAWGLLAKDRIYDLIAQDAQLTLEEKGVQ